MDRFVDESMAVNVLLLLCGIFYAVLCVFSIVTGLMYASGKKEKQHRKTVDAVAASLILEGYLVSLK